VSAPWASFCLATYKRPEFLASTLRRIAAQTFADFEVIVSDNDPARSAAPVAEALAEPRVRYFANQRNLGMVGNFNAALSRATGRFVVMITDDDPPHEGLLEALAGLERAHPGYGGYFGACEVLIEDPMLAGLFELPPGRVRHLARAEEGAVRLFSAQEFPHAFFAEQVFPYVLWSTGVVRSDVAREVGGMPDWGSPFLTDFGYVALAGAAAGMATVNRVLGLQTVHAENFGRAELGEMARALQGFHACVGGRLAQRPDGAGLVAEMERFLAGWATSHALFVRGFHAARGAGAGARRDAERAMEEALRVPWMRRWRRRWAWRRLGADHPRLRRLWHALRGRVR
jgi:hypothetical protein